MLISDHYRDMNTKMNAKHNWASGNMSQLAPMVLNAANEIEAESILDYGSGPQYLEQMMSRVLQKGVFRSYDPGVPGIDQPPEPADLVVCNSVLEHVEPECLDDVMADLARVTKHTLLCIISCYPSGLTLDDGTSPHKIVESPNWWFPHLLKHFHFKRGDNLRQFFFRGTALTVPYSTFKPDKVEHE